MDRSEGQVHGSEGKWLLISVSPLLPHPLPLASCQLSQAAPMLTAEQALKSLWSRDAAFPAAFPGACELLEPLAPPPLCLCAYSVRKEVTCSRVCHKGWVLPPCCCGRVSAFANAFQVTIPRLPPDVAVSNCVCLQALATHNTFLVPSWEFNRAFTFVRVTAGLQGGTVIFGIRVRQQQLRTGRESWAALAHLWPKRVSARMEDQCPQGLASAQQLWAALLVAPQMFAYTFSSAFHTNASAAAATEQRVYQKAPQLPADPVPF